jgi:hypothetical protein
MPALADCACIVMNGKSGQFRSNNHWVLGRLVRAYEYWMDKEARDKLQKVIRDRPIATGQLCANKEDVRLSVFACTVGKLSRESN